MNKLKKICYKGCIVLYGLTVLFALYQSWNLKEGFLMILLSCLLPFVFPVLFFLSGLHMTTDMKLINIIFIYFASLIGSNLGGYNVFLYDKIVHFMSGIVVMLIAYIIYQSFVTESLQSHISPSFLYIFLNAVNLSVGTLWEFFEYFMLIFFNNDCIRHYATGVHDSITDLLCCFVGGILFSIILYMNHKKSHQTIFDNIVLGFYTANPKISSFNPTVINESKKDSRVNYED